MKASAEIGMAICLLANFGMALTLLLIERYFVVESEEEYVYGLTGRYKASEYTSYNELITDCTTETVTPVGCDGLEALEEAGQLFQFLLIADMLVLVTFLFAVIGLRLMLRKLVKSIAAREYVHPRNFSVAKLLMFSRHILLLQPAFLVSGVLAWGEKSDIDGADGDLQAAAGLYLCYVSSFLSLLLVGAYSYYVCSSKRRNLVYMLSQQLRKDAKVSESRIELMEVSLDL